MFKVTDLSESGREIIDLMKDSGFSLDFPFNVCISSYAENDDFGLPIVYEEGKEDTYKNHISLGHYIFEELNKTEKMFEIKIQTIHVDEWGSFLFVNNVLHKYGPSLIDFRSEIFHIVVKYENFLMNYIPPMDVKFKKSVKDECPYNIFYDVERGIHINVFMQWFEEIK